MNHEVFTIGHSNHSLERFIELLQIHAIDAIADVRSAPYSAYNPHFDREELRANLKRKGIDYVFLGKELGARSDDPACYLYGKVQYPAIAKTAAFRHGIERVVEGASTHRIALVCAEKEPLDCHRAILVSRHLTASGVSVKHILADGHLESHNDAISRLARQLRMREQDMFRSHDELLDDIYLAQERRIAYDDAEAKANLPHARTA